jgi:coatomer subunit beta'
VPAAVEAWKADLKAKNRATLADTIASPTTNPEVFEEGWEAALEREAAALSLAGSGVEVNGS